MQENNIDIDTSGPGAEVTLDEPKETLVEEGTEKSQDIQKQITFLNTLSMNILRFRNLRKKIATKGGLV